MLQRNNYVIYYTKPVIIQNQNCIITANQLKGKTMFDMYKDWDKKWQDLAKQVKQVNDFWIDSIISSLKQFQK